jgi:hypothetical protein
MAVSVPPVALPVRLMYGKELLIAQPGTPVALLFIQQ